jgi:hypothetical protein
VKPIGVVVAISAALLIGFLAGREFPAHRYVVASSTSGYIVMVDTKTGQACSPYDASTASRFGLSPCGKSSGAAPRTEIVDPADVTPAK